MKKIFVYLLMLLCIASLSSCSNSKPELLNYYDKQSVRVEAYTLDNTKIGDFDGLSDYEFIEYPYDVIPENENAVYIETEFGRLYIHSDNIFYIKENNVHTYYLIVGDKNFSNIYRN